jgi:GxxExxY protein
MNERELIEIAVGAAYEVANTLGCGFLEKVYERAMMRELASRLGWQPSLLRCHV